MALRALPLVQLLAMAILLLAGDAGAVGGGELEERAMRTNVRLEVDGRFGGGLVVRRVGTGLIVVTAAHVVDGAENVTAELYGFPGLSMKVRTFDRLVDRDADVAVVRIELAPEILPRLGAGKFETSGDLVTEPLDGSLSSDLLSGDISVRLVGQPSFQGWFVSERVEVQRIRSESLRMHHHCVNGMSGGGVFDSRWRLVAMTQRRATAQVCEAVPVARLRAILESWDLMPSWRADPAADRQPQADAPRLSVDAVTGSVKSGTSLTLPARRVASALDPRNGDSDRGTVQLVVGERGLPTLRIEVLAYDTRPVMMSAYGVTVQNHVFTASFRATLHSASGKPVWQRDYPNLEIVDYESQHGWAQRSDPPLAELVERLGRDLLPDLSVRVRDLE